MKRSNLVGQSMLVRLSANCLRCAAGVLLVCGWSLPSSAAARKAEGVEVLVSADTVATSEEFRPKPGQPIYYILNKSQQSLGEVVSGVKMPAPALVEEAVVAELAKQGFVRAKVGGPMPKILLSIFWGDSNFEVPTGDDLENYRAMVNSHGKSEDQILLEMARLRFKLSGRAKDKAAVETMVGMRKPGAAMSLNEDKIVSAANEDRLFLFVAAFDAQTFLEKKEKRLLWRTSMSVYWRNDLAATLPVMLASGGPLFGTNAEEPVFLDERDRRNAAVEVGEARVMPDQNASPLPAKK